MRTFTGIQKTFFAVIAVALAGGAYFFYQSYAGTILGLTLTTNPDLERGLVGHWTFDGEDMDWSSTTAEVRDRGGNNNGDAQPSMSPTVSAIPGTLGQALRFSQATGLTDEHVRIQDADGNTPDSLNPLSNDFSVSLWFNVHERTYVPGDWDGLFACGFPGGVPTRQGYIIRYGQQFGEFGVITTNDSGTEGGPGVTDLTDINVWHHTTFIVDSVGDMGTLYLDGVAVATSTITGSIDCTASDLSDSDNIWIGASYDGAGDDEFPGSLDDVRMYNRALSAEEVKRLYQLGATTKIAQTLNENSDLERGLVGHWTFDGADVDWSSTTAEIRDRSGNNLHADATSLSQSSVNQGVLGQSIELYGTNQSIAVADNDLLDLTNTLSLAVWMRADSCSEDFMSIVTKTTTGSALNYAIMFNIDCSNLRFLIGEGTGSGMHDLSLTQNFIGTGWHHIVGVATSGTISMYVDGVLRKSEAHAITMGPTIKPFCIGQLTSSTLCDSDFFNGSIDDVRIYNRALSVEEIKRLYQLGATTKIAQTLDENPNLENGLVGHWTFDGQDVDWSSTTAEIRDRSGNANHIDTQGGMAPASVAYGPIGQAIQMDGVDDYAYANDSPSLSITSELTVATWVMFPVSPAAFTPHIALVDKQDESDSDSYVLYYEFNNETIRLGTQGANIATARTTWNVGEWYHIVGTFNDAADTIRIYVNGVLDGENTSYTDTMVDSSDKLYLGDVPGSVNVSPFKYHMDDTRIYNRALSADEVKRLYDLGS